MSARKKKVSRKTGAKAKAKAKAAPARSPRRVYFFGNGRADGSAKLRNLLGARGPTSPR